MFEKLILSNNWNYRIIRHVFYWIFFVFFNLHLKIYDIGHAEYLRVFSYLPFYIITTYFFIYIIIPRIINTNKLGNIILLLILFIVLSLFGQELIEYARTGEIKDYFEDYWHEFAFKLTITIAAYVIPSVIKILKYYYYNQKRLLELERLDKENKIRMLTDQLNPHFLFNALATIRGLVGENNNDAVKVINEMSEYFRYSLVNNHKNFRTLEDEISVVKNYIEIQKIRFKSNIKVTYNIEEETKKVIIPVLALQNLVENALKYGSKIHNNNIEIEIRSFFKDNVLKIKVINSGSIKEKTPKPISTKTGLDNLQKRLDLLYPNNNSFNLYEKDNNVYAIITLMQTRTENENMEYNSSG